MCSRPAERRRRGMRRAAAAVFVLAWLAGCSGGDDEGDAGDDSFAALEARAQALAAEARTLGAAAPCGEAAHCGRLLLMPTRGVCPVPTRHALSWQAPDAARAASAAEAQAEVAARAWARQPGGVPAGVACVAGFPDPPAACVAGVCTLPDSP